MSMKNPLTPAGIEPATFPFVAQHLNHCATAVPNSCICNEYNENCRQEYNISISYLKHERYGTARKGHFYIPLSLNSVSEESKDMKLHISFTITG